MCVLKTLNIDAFLICSSWCGTLKRQSRSLVSALRRFESYVTRMTNWPLTFWASSFFFHCKAWRELAWTRLMAETSVSIDFSRFVSLPSFSCLYLFAVAHLDIHYIFFVDGTGGFHIPSRSIEKENPKHKYNSYRTDTYFLSSSYQKNKKKVENELEHQKQVHQHERRPSVRLCTGASSRSWDAMTDSTCRLVRHESRVSTIVLFEKMNG